jgi:ABC-2 type transport system ATP-binding protein
LCDRVTIIKDGRIVESGSLHQLQQFSRLIVNVECARPLTGMQLPGVYGLNCEGNKASFSVDAAALNAVLKKLTECGAVSLHCTTPELEDIFLHYYSEGGQANETK